ncbi:hypothetical protein PtA15_2A443 [Puccinia triticina]|uniref:Uncharacterized protein n=1 Tax=Puccinia triticina TaxID=208348 RepID=A0ABY7CAU0_9BASI|nr:uncharacterized protein PtA15_2A443 [Puccinia triticina]WAQ82129.1 hypothetical protein PtA15_2A443 [Puccinia triticina]WAR52990.1 hypothetical protein PtB15_2B418 [Puccinia triticina]
MSEQALFSVLNSTKEPSRAFEGKPSDSERRVPNDHERSRLIEPSKSGEF